MKPIKMLATAALTVTALCANAAPDSPAVRACLAALAPFNSTWMTPAPEKVSVERHGAGTGARTVCRAEVLAGTYETPTMAAYVVTLRPRDLYPVSVVLTQDGKTQTLRGVSE